MRVCFNETLFLFGVCVCAFAFTRSPDVFGCPLLALSAYSSRKDLSLDSEFMGFPCLFRLEANRNRNHAISAIPHLSAEATGKLKVPSLFCRHWHPNFDRHPWGASTLNPGTISLAFNVTHWVSFLFILWHSITWFHYRTPVCSFSTDSQLVGHNPIGGSNNPFTEVT